MDTKRSALSDFHFHTVHSDGSETVASAIEEAKARGVASLALTDHNDGEGMPEFISLCKASGLKYVEGVEIYAAFPLSEEWSQDPSYCSPIPDLTILGRKLDWRIFKEEYVDPLMQYWQTIFVPQSLKQLEENGLTIPEIAEVKFEDFATAIGILHDVPNNPQSWGPLLEIAKQHKPDITAEDIEQSPVRWANRYLYAFGMNAYVLRGPKEFTVEHAVDLAEEMGGLLFAAHPGGEYANWSEEHLQYFIEAGGHGIEAWQYFHSQEQIRHFLELAIQHELTVSGGSDWHGTNGRPTMGCWDKQEAQTPSWVFEQLMDRLP
ncbi:PHP domain-containing protein [Patescibacteria group bacterium]|nr:PHP domain-containing protein [Patescibacteria group bacterium]MBU4511779.1 PHP domain-containing protein [Patescibacteria group bacterium]